MEYPAYGVTGPNKDISPSGDRRLAQSAQMYHYQHQKQQIIAMENRTNQERNGTLSDVESDDENEEGDYTVYECPGLAPVSLNVTPVKLFIFFFIKMFFYIDCKHGSKEPIVFGRSNTSDTGGNYGQHTTPKTRSASNGK